MYTYRVIGVKNGGEYFVFRFRIIPKKGRRKMEVALDQQGDNPVARFWTIELVRAERDRLEQEQAK